MTPDDVIALPRQKDTSARKLDMEAAADEYQESCSFLAPHPLHSLVTRG